MPATQTVKRGFFRNLLDAALARLQSGRPAEFAPFDQRTRQRVGQKRVLPTESGSIVVEGIVALYAEHVLATSTLALYVDAPPEVREARQLVRLDREGWYRDLPRAEIEARIRAKRDNEDTIVRRQLAYCQYAIVTAGPARASTRRSQRSRPDTDRAERYACGRPGPTAGGRDHQRRHRARRCDTYRRVSAPWSEIASS